MRTITTNLFHRGCHCDRLLVQNVKTHRSGAHIERRDVPHDDERCVRPFENSAAAPWSIDRSMRFTWRKSQGRVASATSTPSRSARYAVKRETNRGSNETALDCGGWEGTRLLAIASETARSRRPIRCKLHAVQIRPFKYAARLPSTTSRSRRACRASHAHTLEILSRD